MKSKSELTIVADTGDVEAQINLGKNYALEGDYQQEFFWYQKAADQGAPNAIYKLALYYQNTRYVKKDYKKALEYYKKIAEPYVYLGVTYEPCDEAIYGIALLYHDNKINCYKPYQRAREYYKKLILKESNIQAEVIYNLGLTYLQEIRSNKLNNRWHGPGDSDNLEQATYCIRRAIYLGYKGSKIPQINFISEFDQDVKMLRYNITGFYHKVMLLKQPLNELFFTHCYVSNNIAQFNLSNLKTFLEDPWLSHTQKKEYLKQFSQSSWRFCTWMRLLPGKVDEETLRTLHGYLLDISEELTNETEKQKFIAADMLPATVVAAHKETRRDILFQSIETIRRELESLLSEQKEQTTAVKIIGKLTDWVRDFRDSHLSIVEPSLPLPEQLRYFLEHYHFILETTKPQLTVDLYNRIKTIANSCSSQEAILREKYIERLSAVLKEDSILLFKRVLSLRLQSTWSAAMTIYSGYVEYHNEHMSLVKSGLGLIEGGLECIPMLGGIGKITKSLASILALAHGTALVFEVVSEGIHVIKACVEGGEFFNPHYGKKALCRVYLNLGVKGSEYIDSISTAFCSRYEEQITSISKQKPKEVIQFAEDTASFILKFLMTVSLTEKERDESLHLLLMLWCTRHSAGKGHALESLHSGSEKIFSGDLLSRVELACQYEEKETTSSAALGISPFWLKKEEMNMLNPERFGRAKANCAEVALFRKQLQRQELSSSSSSIGDSELALFKASFSPEILLNHTGRLGLFKPNLKIELPLHIRVKQLEKADAEKEQRLRKLEDAMQLLSKHASTPDSELKEIARRL